MRGVKCEGEQPTCLKIYEIVAEPFSAPDRYSAALHTYRQMRNTFEQIREICAAWIVVDS